MNIHIILSISMLCLYILLIALFSYSHRPNSANYKEIAEENLFLQFKEVWNETQRNEVDSLGILPALNQSLKNRANDNLSNFSLLYNIILVNTGEILLSGEWSNIVEKSNSSIIETKSFDLSETHRVEFSFFQLDPKNKKINSKITLKYSLILGFFTLIILLLIYNWHKKRQKNQLKTDYMYGVTHEMKSILTTIILAGEFIKNNKGVKNEEEYKNIIIQESKEMLKMVQQVLNISVMEKNELSFNYELISIQELIEETVQSYSVKINNFQGHIEFINEVSDKQFWADKILLKLALSNLIDNSIKYSAFHPIIKISAQEEQGYYVIKIKDNGIGIPKSQLNNIFKPTVRLKNAVSKKPSGVGMGLYFVKQIIKIHKGKIKVNSELNKGSEFCVYIPKYE